MRDLLQQQQNTNVSTFRQPLPPSMIATRSVPQRSVSSGQSQQAQQTNKSAVISVQNIPIVSSANENVGPNVNSQQVVQQSVSINTNSSEHQKTNQTTHTEQPQMIENFGNPHAHELEKLEVGDILGDLGDEDDDDELLKSFTADMGVDFNILEYADPELDALDEADQSNLLDSFDFDETDERERAKRVVLEKLNKVNESKAAIGQLKLNHNQGADQQTPMNNRPQQTQQQIMMQQR